MSQPILSTDFPAARLARAWMVLAVCALAGSGAIALLLVAARSESFHDWVPYDDLFTKALIIHVNLSVLVWLLSAVNAFQCRLFSHTSPQRWLPFWVAVTGAVIFSASPFVEEGTALMNNYVPIIDSQSFYLGIGLFLIGSLSQSIWLLPASARPTDDVQYVGIRTTVVMNVMAFIAFFWSYTQLQEAVARHVIGVAEQMEMLFWGGGHALQFSYTGAMLLAWVWLVRLCGLPLAISPGLLRFCYVLPLVVVLLTPLIYLLTDVTSIEHRELFTQQMRWGLGIAPLILGWFVLRAILSTFCSSTHPGLSRMSMDPRNKSGDVELLNAGNDNSYLWHSLLWSVIVFGAGGVIGFAIREVNTVIPAHYHGSIVGVTIALMGLFYYLLPQCGFGAINKRWARVQPYFYGLGALLHIIGFAMAGGYGAMRKTAGAAPSEQAALWIDVMRFGGALTILGGAMFVVLALKSILRKK